MTLGLHAHPFEAYFHSRNIFTAIRYISSVYIEGFYDILRGVLCSNKLSRYFIALEGLYINKIYRYLTSKMSLNRVATVKAEGTDLRDDSIKV